LTFRLKREKINKEIIYFTAASRFSPKYAVAGLQRLKGQIKIVHLDKEKTRGLYIAESNWNEELCLISI